MHVSSSVLTVKYRFLFITYTVVLVIKSLLLFLEVITLFDNVKETAEGQSLESMT